MKKIKSKRMKIVKDYYAKKTKAKTPASKKKKSSKPKKTSGGY